MAGLFLKELKLRRALTRTLIVAPANLAPQWQREMAEKFDEPFDLVNRVYRTEAGRLHLDTENIIADFTGGTKPMSAGMIVACADRRPMQYMTGRRVGIASMPKRVEIVRRGQGSG